MAGGSAGYGGVMASWHETRVERLIREAQERGEVADLPGAGRPLPGAGEPYDENWWLKSLVRRERLSGAALSPVLALRKESEDLARIVAAKPTEESVREFVDDLNARIREARSGVSDGPALVIRTHDVEKVVAAWRRARADRAAPGRG
jgi:hypothetical protein